MPSLKICLLLLTGDWFGIKSQHLRQPNNTLFILLPCSVRDVMETGREMKNAPCLTKDTRIQKERRYAGTAPMLPRRHPIPTSTDFVATIGSRYLQLVILSIVSEWCGHFSLMRRTLIG